MMKLPAKAKGDLLGSTYPMRLGNVDGAKKLHVLAPGSPWRSLCGVVTEGAIENVGMKPRTVCAECRRAWKGEDDDDD